MIEQHNETIRLTLLGPERVGKSSFLAGLACLGFDMLGSPLTLFPRDHDSAACLNSLRETLLAGSWPPRTATTTLLHFDLKLSTDRQPRNGLLHECVHAGKYSLELATIDYPGEDFRAAMNELAPEKIELFHHHLNHSDVLLLLIGANELLESENNIANINDRLRCRLAAVHEIVQKQAEQGGRPIALCIGITGADRIAELDESIGKPIASRVTRQYVQNRLAFFVSKLHEETGIDRIEYFPLSAGGKAFAESIATSGSGIVPRPAGYLTLFDWIVQSRKRVHSKHRHGCLFYLGMFFFVAVLAAAGIFFGMRYRQQLLYDNTQLTAREKIIKCDVGSLIGLDPDRRDSLVFTELERIRALLQKTSDPERLRQLSVELTEFSSHDLGGAKIDADLLIRDIHQKLIESEFEQVQTAIKKAAPDAATQATLFIKHYPNTTFTEKVRDSLNLLTTQEWQQQRKILFPLPVKDRISMGNKCDALFDYLAKYGSHISKTERYEIRTAVKLARRFCVPGNYKVTLVRYGGFAYNENQRFLVKVDHQIVCRDTSGTAKSKEVHASQDFSMKWEYGQEIRLELLTDDGFLAEQYETVAAKTLVTPDSLKLLARRQLLTPQRTNRDWSASSRQDTSGYFVELRVHDISPEEWQAFDRYIYPGHVPESSDSTPE